MGVKDSKNVASSTTKEKEPGKYITIIIILIITI